jgi:hypothetical protein
MDSQIGSWSPMVLKKIGTTLGDQIEPSLDIEKVLENTYLMWGHIPHLKINNISYILKLK